jgi:hypothetical protein
VAPVHDVVQPMAKKILALGPFLLLGTHRKTPEIVSQNPISGILQYFASQKNPLDSISCDFFRAD